MGAATTATPGQHQGHRRRVQPGRALALGAEQGQRAQRAPPGTTENSTAPSEVDPTAPARRLPAAAGRPGDHERRDPHRDVDVEHPAPGGREQVDRPRDPGATPSRSSATSGWNEPRIAAPSTGPAAMPRKVSAPITPSARGRAAPSYRWDAAARRDRDQRAAADGLDEAGEDQQLERRRRAREQRAEREHDERPEEQPAGAEQVGEPTRDRHRDHVHQQVAVDDPRRLAEAGPAGEVDDDGRAGPPP